MLLSSFCSCKRNTHKFIHPFGLSRWRLTLSRGQVLSAFTSQSVCFYFQSFIHSFIHSLLIVETIDPVIKIPFSNVYQHVCTYRDLYYKTFELPACPPGVDPIVTYPVALSCHCGRCAMDTSDCTFESLQPDFCMNDIPFYY
uniref:Gonadotropin subunit beta-2 n=1 Tax=Maylandia zebra TaxID=106582 RepID=A0A3P9DUY4_9CICH